MKKPAHRSRLPATHSRLRKSIQETRPRGFPFAAGAHTHHGHPRCASAQQTEGFNSTSNCTSTGFQSFTQHFSPRPTPGPRRQFSPHRLEGQGSPGAPLRRRTAPALPGMGLTSAGHSAAPRPKQKHPGKPRTPARQDLVAAAAAPPGAGPGLTWELGPACQPSRRCAGPAALHTAPLPPLRHAAASAPAWPGPARPAAPPASARRDWGSAPLHGPGPEGPVRNSGCRLGRAWLSSPGVGGPQGAGARPARAQFSVGSWN